MDPASKTSRNTSSSRIGQVDTVVKLKPKKMVKEEMKGGNGEQGRKKMLSKTYVPILKLKKKIQRYSTIVKNIRVNEINIYLTGG